MQRKESNRSISKGQREGQLPLRKSEVKRAEVGGTSEWSKILRILNFGSAVNSAKHFYVCVGYRGADLP